MGTPRNSSATGPAAAQLETATDLAGKAVVITGGTTGIGRATASLLTAHGAKVFIFGRHERELREALEEIGEGAFGIVADQSKSSDLERVFREADQQIGGCDILINNAAVSGGKLEEKGFDDIHYVVTSNLVGYLASTHHALHRMKQERGGGSGTGAAGHIVNVGSMSADLREEGGEIYVATKAAIQAFSESLRKSANKDNIRVTLIEPGAVATPIQEKSPDQEREKLEKQEMILPEDVARCILYCLTQPQRVDVVSVQLRPLKQII
jgi:NADP-dependent 3-hydroxy acid dehydrogenase YdfG